MLSFTEATIRNTLRFLAAALRKRLAMFQFRECPSFLLSLPRDQGAPASGHIDSSDVILR
jgi:hypothetical protein